MEQWLARDPVRRLKAALVAAGCESETVTAEAAAVAAIDDAVAFAADSPPARADAPARGTAA